MKKLVKKLFACLIVAVVLVSMAAPVVTADEYEVNPLCDEPPALECSYENSI